MQERTAAVVGHVNAAKNDDPKEGRDWVWVIILYFVDAAPRPAGFLTKY